MLYQDVVELYVEQGGSLHRVTTQYSVHSNTSIAVIAEAFPPNQDKLDKSAHFSLSIRQRSGTGYFVNDHRAIGITFEEGWCGEGRPQWPPSKGFRTYRGI